MTQSDDWLRVSRSKPCPVCGKPDWCLVSEDGSTAICPRTPEGAVKQTKASGYLHKLNRDTSRLAARSTRISIGNRKQFRSDLIELARTYKDAVNPCQLNQLAGSLGVTTNSLHRLDIGFAGWGWTFPMTDANGDIRGIRIRKHDSQKLAIKGSHEGLFIPIDLTTVEQLFICEGSTDTAAILDLGFDAVGRPSCLGGVNLLDALIRKLQPNDVVIVADHDKPGQRGACNLAQKLIRQCPVRVITPPIDIKDARAWKRTGASSSDITTAIQNARVHQISISKELKP